MKTYGYVRCSTQDQNLDRQILAMRELKILRKYIYIERQSGKDFERPEYQKLLKRLKKGDLLHITSIDRLGRNYDEILTQWRILTKEKGVDIAVSDMPLLDTRMSKDVIGVFTADIVLQILSYVAHSERETMRRRQAEGIAAAKRRGVQLGRPPKKMPKNFRAIVNQWRCGNLTTKEAVRLCKISPSTFYEKLKRYNLPTKRKLR